MKVRNVLVVGLGEIGTAIASFLKNRPNISLQTRDKKNKKIILPIDVMHICYPYTNDFVKTTLQYRRKYEPELILIESTVLPGTTGEIQHFLEKYNIKTMLCHSPIRGRHAEGLENGLLKYTKFIGPARPEFGSIAEHYYNSLGLKTCVCRDALTTEFIKILSTTYYGLMIAYWQEIRRITKQFGLAENEIRQWFLTSTLESHFQHMRPVFYPSKIGGHCVMPNLHLLNRVFPSKFVDVILESNDKARNNG